MSMTLSFHFSLLALHCLTLTVSSHPSTLQRGVFCAILVGCNRWCIDYLDSRVE